MSVKMTYADKDMVKIRIGIDITETKRDNEIDAALTFADAMIDEALMAAGGSGSLSSPAQSVKESSADLAAYFIYRVKNPSTATLYWDSAMTLLKNYIRRSLIKGAAELAKKDGVVA